MFVAVLRDYVGPNKSVDDLFFVVMFLEALTEIKGFGTYVMKLLPKTQKGKVEELVVGVREAQRLMEDKLSKE